MNAIRLATLAAILASGLAHGAEAIVYKQQNFAGEQLPVRGAAYDLAAVNFHDQISSIVVHSGAWEVCTQPNFRGDCMILQPGSYGALESRINHRIESMREAPQYALEARRAEAAVSRDPNAAALELFASPGFRGKAHPVRRDARTLVETGFDAQAGSMVVREGVWQGCTEPGYQGVCRIFSPGRYGDVGAPVVSLRRVKEALGSP